MLPLNALKSPCTYNYTGMGQDKPSARKVHEITRNYKAQMPQVKITQINLTYLIPLHLCMHAYLSTKTDTFSKVDLLLELA